MVMIKNYLLLDSQNFITLNTSMRQSRILGQLQMTHSKYIDEEQVRKNKDQQKQDQQIYKTLANYARQSYVANKKGSQEIIKAEDAKPRRKNTIFHQKAERLIADLTVSKLPNYNILQVENISKNNVSCWQCSIFPKNNNVQYKFVMEDPCRLIIYAKGTEKIVYAFNFDTVEVELRQKFSSKGNQFLLIAGPLILRISHESNNIVQSWYQQLNKITEKSFGKMFKMTDIITKDMEHFYKKLYCTEDEFTSNCETGDILLFQDEHFFAKAQRFILNADYDHVAMIIRDKKYGILMFEASSLSGVSLNPWNCMIKYGWFKYIKRIVWRRLQNVQRSKFFQQIIHKFVKQNLKTKYFISFEKLLANQSFVGVKEEEKGFFCSQLVAKVYKDLEILTRDPKNQHYIASNKVYPYHFSEKHQLKLEMGNLSKEYEIHFNDDLLKKQYGDNFIQS